MRPPFSLSFSRRLFLSVIILFASYAMFFLFFQYQREKTYKSDILNIKLQSYNNQLHDQIVESHNLDVEQVRNYIALHMLPNLRVTLINGKGKVLFDNTRSDWQHMSNHLNRKEVQDALLNGSGYAVARHSQSIEGEEYFYAAQYYSDFHLIIRSALPYNVSLIQHLKIDTTYIWITTIIGILLIFIFYRFTYYLGMSIRQLQQFANRADRNEEIDMETYRTFPNNELGAISRHIIQIYERMHRAKQALTIEREKLILHLQTSHEGLGVFTKKRKEILVNNLFTQYINIISDKNLSAAEAIFDIPELQPITDFLQKGVEAGKEQRTSVKIHKNAHTFIVEAIVFQDQSFEISINDITKDEEQAQLKRELTQNIAHELKTPVSSIQGYMETLINNPQIPDDKKQVFIERSYAQSNRLATLLQDISALTRMDEAPEQIDKEHLDICPIVANTFNDVALKLEEKRISVHNAINKSLPITGNYSLLYSIFRNLIDNTIAYAGTDLEVTIECFKEDDRFYYFSYSDNGIGVSEEHLNRLFERFYRVDKGRSRKQGGTGLGLSIVKNAVILHGGTIFAKQAPRGGLEFVFTLAK